MNLYPDKQGRSAEEAAEYWYNAYWDWMWKRCSSVQLYSLMDQVWAMQACIRRQDKIIKDWEELFSFVKSVKGGVVLIDYKDFAEKYESFKHHKDVRSEHKPCLESSKYLRYPYEGK